MKTVLDTTGKIKAKSRNDANNNWWVSELLATDCKNMDPPFQLKLF